MLEFSESLASTAERVWCQPMSFPPCGLIMTEAATFGHDIVVAQANILGPPSISAVLVHIGPLSHLENSFYAISFSYEFPDQSWYVATGTCQARFPVLWVR